MTPEAHARLCKLLPKLGALTDAHRLKLLADIDRIFVREGITWEDVTARLLAPSIDGEELSEIVAFILKQEGCYVSTSAHDFLTQMQNRAAHGGSVRLSPAQCTWLFALRDQAAKAAAEKAEDAADEQQERANIIKLERAPTDTAH